MNLTTDPVELNIKTRKNKCNALTKKGKDCNNSAKEIYYGYCGVHKKMHVELKNEIPFELKNEIPFESKFETGIINNIFKNKVFGDIEGDRIDTNIITKMGINIEKSIPKIGIINIGSLNPKAFINLNDSQYKIAEAFIIQNVVYNNCTSIRVLQKLGSGVQGDVYSCQLNIGKNIKIISIVAKVSGSLINLRRNSYVRTRGEYIVEYIIGLSINSFRADNNNFALTYAIFNGQSDTFNVLRNKMNKLGDVNPFHIKPELTDKAPCTILLTQKACGSKFCDMIKKMNLYDIQCVVTQVIAAVCYAQLENLFQHRDLHWENVLVNKLNDKKIFKYYIGEREYSITTEYEATIIDYGMTTAFTNNEYVGMNNNNYHFGFDASDDGSKFISEVVYICNKNDINCEWLYPLINDINAFSDMLLISNKTKSNIYRGNKNNYSNNTAKIYYPTTNILEWLCNNTKAVTRIYKIKPFSYPKISYKDWVRQFFNLNIVKDTKCVNNIESNTAKVLYSKLKGEDIILEPNTFDLKTKDKLLEYKNLKIKPLLNTQLLGNNLMQIYQNYNNNKITSRILGAIEINIFIINTFNNVINLYLEMHKMVKIAKNFKYAGHFERETKEFFDSQKYDIYYKNYINVYNLYNTAVGLLDKYRREHHSGGEIIDYKDIKYSLEL
jgi:hypothetical protein